MSEDAEADRLREMAEHRGLKLVKSRRRKPGVGDYGKFGLTDAAGKPLLGIGNDGLTAAAQDIEAYLRAGGLGTWQESAELVPDRAPSTAKAAPPTPSPPRKPKPAAPAKPRARAPAKAPERKTPEPAPAPPPAPKLVIRPAGPSDADALASLLNRWNDTTLDREALQRNLAAASKAKSGLLLAELDQPIGCCGWAVVPTIQHGLVGRITLIVVDRDHRRRGIARQLLAAAEQALKTKGCTLVEAMSDIQINNAHNFFRALDFEQTSYRFARRITE